MLELELDNIENVQQTNNSSNELYKLSILNDKYFSKYKYLFNHTINKYDIVNKTLNPFSKSEVCFLWDQLFSKYNLNSKQTK